MGLANSSYYIKDGLLYDRASTILDFVIEPWMVEWKQKVGKVECGKRSRLALKIGSRVDELVERDCLDGSYSLKKSDLPEVHSCMSAWNKFKQRYDVSVLSTQETVYNKELRVAGTLDLILLINGVVMLVDIKSSISISIKYWLQTSFYYWTKELRKINGNSCTGIIRLDKQASEFEFMDNNKANMPLEQSRDAFRNQVNLYRFYNAELDITKGENHERIKREISE
jgi:hypothetical protein